jgi:hypothetical protein
VLRGCTTSARGRGHAEGGRGVVGGSTKRTRRAVQIRAGVGVNSEGEAEYALSGEYSAEQSVAFEAGDGRRRPPGVRTAASMPPTARGVPGSRSWLSGTRGRGGGNGCATTTGDAAAGTVTHNVGRGRRGGVGGALAGVTAKMGVVGLLREKTLPSPPGA